MKQQEGLAFRYEKHGASSSALYRRWAKMRARCSDPNSNRYKQYGARGISVCKEWDNSFTVFKDWAMVNGYGTGMSLERIDVNGNYCPENCTYIPKVEQAFNKRNTLILNYKGGSIIICKWIRETCQQSKYRRLFYYLFQKKWDFEKVIEKLKMTPPNTNHYS